MADCLEINTFFNNLLKELYYDEKNNKCYNVYSYVHTVLIKQLHYKYRIILNQCQVKLQKPQINQ